MLFFVILGVIIAIVLYSVISKNKKQSQYENSQQYQQLQQNIPYPPQEQNTAMPYVRKNLLTKNEWGFYKQLKPIADKLNLHILAKVRLADLVEVQRGLNNSEWQTAFNRINKKHIDFVLCNPDNLYPLLLIELDDSSHQQDKQKARDIFVEGLYKKTGYKLLRVSGSGNIEEKIRKELNIQPPASAVQNNTTNERTTETEEPAREKV